MPVIPPMILKLVENYNYLMVDLRDKRTDNYPLMSSVWPTVVICLLYVYVVKVAGPKYFTF